MKIADIMTKQVDRVTPKSSISDAARKMRDDGVGALPVEANDRLVGMVTDRDIVTRVLAEGTDVTRADVGDAMTEKVRYVFEDENAAEVARNMADERIRRMPVVNRDKRLVGIVSLGDLSEELPAETAGEALGTISTAA